MTEELRQKAYLAVRNGLPGWQLIRQLIIVLDKQDKYIERLEAAMNPQDVADCVSVIADTD